MEGTERSKGWGIQGDIKDKRYIEIQKDGGYSDI